MFLYILIDYTGSSPQTKKAINSVPNYTFAYTAYGVKCMLDPETPNNAGCFRPMRVTAPPGTILSAVPPAAVNARQLVGNNAAISDVCCTGRDHPRAGTGHSGGAPIWGISFSGKASPKRSFVVTIQLSGGQGARYGKDGISALSFPSCASNTPVEITEVMASLLIECKELIPDSGGAGIWRGGCGQRVVFRSRSRFPIRTSLITEKIKRGSFGLFGGGEGRAGAVLREGQSVPVPRVEFTCNTTNLLLVNCRAAVDTEAPS